MRTALYVADVAQSLADGKLSIMGLYTDRVLQMVAEANAGPSSELPFGVTVLSIVITIMDLEPGEHDVQIRLIEPNGDPYPSPIPNRRLRMLPGGSANVLMSFAPFVVRHFGRFDIMITADDSVNARESFEIRRIIPGSVPESVLEHLPPEARARFGNVAEGAGE